MKTPSPKTDRLRELREAKHAKTEKRVINARELQEAITYRSPTNAERQAKWREENIDTHRERSRNAVRKKRGKHAAESKEDGRKKALKETG